MDNIIIADRTLISILAFRGDQIPEDIYKHLAKYNSIASESGGASGLAQDLEANNKISSKFYRITENDMINLSSKDGDELLMLLAKLKNSDIVIKAMRHYKIESGRMSESEDELLGYIMRLLLLSAKIDADLFVWNTRYNIIKAILKSGEIEYQENTSGKITHLYTIETLFPLTYDKYYTAREIKLMSYLYDKSSTNDYFSNDVKSEDNEIPPINLSMGGPSINIVAWLKYIKKKLKNKGEN